MSAELEILNNRKVAWVSGTDLFTELDAATWLETTRVLRNLGWEVTLISEGASGSYTLRGVPVTGFLRPRIYFLGSMVLHIRILSLLWQLRGELDIILFHQISAIWMMTLWMALRVMGRRNPQFVMDTRDVPDYGTGLKHWLRVAYFKLMHRWANVWANGQTAITEKMAELVDIPAGKLLGIWPSGADVNLFQSARGKRRWPGEDEPVVLMYIGKLHYERKLLELCRSVVAANENGMAFRFTLAGDGPQRDTLRQFANHSNGAVVVLDPIEHGRIPELLAEAHIGVTPLPSWDDRKFETSSPIKMFEYMAAGLPLLSTRNICHTAIVGDDDYAFWADDGQEEKLYEVLVQIWDQRGELSLRGARAAKASAHWSWHASGNKLSEALKVSATNAVVDKSRLDLKEVDPSPSRDVG